MCPQVRSAKNISAARDAHDATDLINLKGDTEGAYAAETASASQ